MILGFDVGSSGVKAVLLDADGRPRFQGDEPHNLSTPHPGWAEEDPAAWWRGVLRLAGRAAVARGGERLRGLGISTMTPAVILLDRSGAPVRPSIQQNDARSAAELQRCRARYADDDLFPRAGSVWNQQMVPQRLMWIREREPEVWRRAVRVTGAVEYLTHRLTGAVYAEANWALESGMWDVRWDGWNRDLLERLELAELVLPSVKRAHEPAGELLDADAVHAGLPRGLPVIAGSADHMAAALGAGLRRSGDVVLKFGGGGDVLFVMDGFTPVRELYIDFHDIPGLYVLNGCMTTSGSLAAWFRDHFRPGQSFADLDREAASVPAGADGVVVLPYFLGEKTPIHDPYARGTIVGLTLSHTPAHLFRAALEGVSYAFRHHLEVIESAGHRIDRIYVADGGARSALWRTITASVLNREVNLLEGGQATSAYGTAVLAGVAQGMWTWSDFPVPRISTVTAPDPGSVAVYDDLYAAYRDVYRRLKDLYPRLSERPAR